MTDNRECDMGDARYDHSAVDPTRPVLVTVEVAGGPTLRLVLCPEAGGGYGVFGRDDRELTTQGDTIGGCVDMAIDALTALTAVRSGRFVSPAADRGNVFAMPLSEWDMPLRVRKAFRRMNLLTVGELCDKTVDDLMGQKNFGLTSLRAIQDKLRDLGLRLRG